MRASRRSQEAATPVGSPAAPAHAARKPPTPPDPRRRTPPETPHYLRALASDLTGSRFAYHRDSDLPGIRQLILDLLRKIARQHLGADVVHRIRDHHHPHLTAGLHGEDLVDAGQAGGDK